MNSDIFFVGKTATTVIPVSLCVCVCVVCVCVCVCACVIINGYPKERNRHYMEEFIETCTVCKGSWYYTVY